jgi:hypothetical protein
MPAPEITGPADLALLFSLLHDGVVAEAVRDGDDLALRVEIRYLTQRIAPSFTFFHVRLHGVADVTFDPWPKAADAAAETWRDVPQIFSPPLDILEGAAAGDGVAVHCNQPAREAPHCGGTLRLRAAAASVTDEAGARYDLAALKALADEYWDDWRTRHGRPARPTP